MSWDDLNREERAKLVRFYLLDKRWTYGQLASYLGVTRNVIAGICNRHGIYIHKQTVKTKPSTPPVDDNVAPFPLTPRPSREEAVSEMAKKVKAKLKVKRKNSTQSAVIQVMAGRKEDNDNGQFKDFRPLRADIWRPLEETSPVHFQNTKTLQCRWPVSEDNHWCCGQPVKDGKPYCHAHSAIAYRPAPEIEFKKSRKAAR